MAVALLLVGSLTEAAFARQSCATADHAVSAAGACCAKVAASDAGTESGAKVCPMHCSAAGCAAVMAPSVAALAMAPAHPGMAAPVCYSGWTPIPAAPPPRSLILA